VEDGIVVDPAKLLPFFGAETIFADNYGVHTVTEALRQARLPAVFALARPVRKEGGDGTVTELVKTSDEGWGETNLEDLSAVELDDEDFEGPVSLGVAIELAAIAVDGEPEPEATVEEADTEPLPVTEAEEIPSLETETDELAATPGRLVVFGDADFVTNGQITQAGNATLVANTLNWLVERESHLGIPPKEPEQVRLTLTPQQQRLFFWLVIVGLPGGSLIAGVMVYVRRRR